MTTRAQTRAAIAAQNETQLLRAQLEHATVKLATAQAENRRLRRMTTNGRMGRILHRTGGDARQIIGWRWAGFSVGRQQALSYGMSRRRWHWAVALLERARVVKPDARYLDDAFDVEDLADALAAIERTVKVLEQSGLASLEMRLPRNGFAGRRRSR